MGSDRRSTGGTRVLPLGCKKNHRTGPNMGISTALIRQARSLALPSTGAGGPMESGPTPLRAGPPSGAQPDLTKSPGGHVSSTKQTFLFHK